MAAVAPNVAEPQREPLTPQEFPSVFVTTMYSQFHDIPRVPFDELKPQKYYLEFNRYRHRFSIIYVCNIMRFPFRHIWYYRPWTQNIEDHEWIQLDHELLSDGEDEVPFFLEPFEYFDLENGFDLGTERVQLDHSRVSLLSCGPLPNGMLRPPGRMMNRFLRTIDRVIRRGGKRKTQRKHMRRRKTRRFRK